MKLGTAHLRKRLAGALLACMTALTAVQPIPLPASAESGSCGTSATWTLNNDVLTISGTGAVSTATWSAYSKRVTAIVVEDGITSLPSHSFDAFSVLTSIKMADSVTSIGSSLCTSCPKLKTIEFSQNLTEIPSSAFYFCYSIESLSLPKNLKKIGSTAFYGMLNLTSLTLPSGVTEVGSSAFYGNNITSLTLSDSLQTIGDKAFGMSCFQEVTIPETVQTIGKDAIGKYYEYVSMTGSKMYGNYVGEPGVTTIRGKAGSAAETYAKSAGLNFVPLGEDVHTHAWSDWTVSAPAGCETEGKRTRSCSGCGETESERIPATGHSWGNWSVDTPATAWSEGTESRTCANCNQKESRPIPALGHSSHTWGEWKTDPAAGCETEGKRTRTCTECGETESETIPAAGHNWGEWTVDTPATGWSEGSESRACTSCGKTETRSIPASGHSSHTWGDWVTDSAASCTKAGTQHHTCTECGETESETIPATGHSWGEWNVVREATLTEEGLQQRSCQNGCGETQSDAIPMLVGYTVSVTAGEGGSVSPDGVTTVEAGGSLTIRVSANGGWHLVSLLIDGTERTPEADGTYTISNIQENHTVVAAFQQDAPKNERSCGLISVMTSRAAWCSDEAAFRMSDFTVLASITENGSTSWVDITNDCEPLLTPAQAAENSYGNTTVSFRYKGADSDVAAFAQKNPIQADVQVYLRGDGDGNGIIDVLDAMMALIAYAEVMAGNSDGLTDVRRVILDVDGKDAVTLEDSMYILTYYAQLMCDLVPSWEEIMN